MRSFLHWLLTILTLGMISVGCSRQPTELGPRDVTLVVPGMFWASGWPDRVRKALATLPWVEQESVLTDVPSREVRFNLKDRKSFSEADLKTALGGQRFNEMTVKARPK